MIDKDILVELLESIDGYYAAFPEVPSIEKQESPEYERWCNAYNKAKDALNKLKYNPA